MSTLADEYPKEQERCRELLEAYIEIGPPGQFGASMLRQLLKRAEIAAAEQDLLAMIQCFQEMKDSQ